MAESIPEQVPRRRLLVFRAILSLPLVLVLLILFTVGWRIARMNLARADELAKTVESRVGFQAVAQGEVQAREGRPSIQVEGQWVPVDARDGERLIYTVGASSLVVPSLDVAFPTLLQRRIDADAPGRYRVVNLGVRGLTAAHLQARLHAVLEAGERPSLVVFYEGHNDYGLVYREAVLPTFSVIGGSAFLDALVSPVLVATRYHDYTQYRFALGTSLDPELLREIQSLGLLHPDPRLVPTMDAVAVRAFDAALQRLLAEVRERGVPAVLMTPISNLEFRSLGADGEAEAAWQRGRDASELPVRLAEWRRARDLDAFNFDIRAKSGVSELIRGQRGEGIHLLDLERQLEADGFPFDHTAFVDSVHFNPDTHQRVAEKLYGFLKTQRLLESAPSAAVDAEKPR